MGFFKNLGDELGTSTGKGFAAIVSTLWKLLCSFASWLFRWEHKAGEHELHTNSFRLAAVSLILALLFVPGLVTCTFNPLKILNVNGSTSVRLNVALHKQEIPYFPRKERFAINHDQNVQYYDDFGGRKLYTFHRNSNGKPHAIKIEGRSCAVVPAGEEINFLSVFPPVYVANMKDNVTYTKKEQYITLADRVMFLINPSKGSMSSDTWIHISDHWGEVNPDTFFLHAEALDKKDIDEDTAGGLVCF